MMEHIGIEIEALRKIGWDHWDPIGIRQMFDESWCEQAADEYDSYLLQAARMILQGCEQKDVAAWLDEIITRHMGLEPLAGASMRTVKAIAALLARGT